jgi:DNA-binding LytR/AlgR family response regulator
LTLIFLSTNENGTILINNESFPLLIAGLSIITEHILLSVFLKDGSEILVSKRLKLFEEVFKERPAFYRPHRSFIVNINFVKKLNRNESTLELDNNSCYAF